MPEMPTHPSSRPPLIQGLVRLNQQVSSWAASMSWVRLGVLFLVVLAAAAMVGEQLHLQHDSVKVRRAAKEDVEVTIFGPDGIRISQRHPRRTASAAEGLDLPAVPPVPPLPQARDGSAAPPSAAPKSAAPPSAAASAADEDEDDEDVQVFKRQVITFRGLVGDLGSALLICVFAYLVAAKIVVRKVKESDAKVKTAESVAEQEAMQRQLVQARLQVLQAQVEPHFLFNTLSAVDYLIETDPPRASQMQKALITYLRGALPQMRLEASTLGREMRLIRSYLELIKMRIEDRLEVEFAVPEGAESAEFPPMMLQSLVENAIKHGIEPKPEGGKVTVAARIQNGQLWVEVKDTGVGVHDMDRLDSAPTSGTGIGLQNIRERLAMLYPGRSRLTLMSDDNGTTVRIVVPYQVGAEAMAAFDDGARPA